jgi:cell division protein FtsB
MIAKLTQAIQAQQKLIDDLTARVAELEAKNCNCRGEQKLIQKKFFKLLSLIKSTYQINQNRSGLLSFVKLT